jgi:hypothetical protein
MLLFTKRIDECACLLQTYQFSVKWHTSRPAFEHVIDEVIERIRKELLS